MRDDPAVVDLVVRAREGDKSAWDEIVTRYAPLVWSICRRYRLAEHDAEDVGQTIWLSLVEHLATLQQAAALPGWLATATQRECARVLRSNRKRVDNDLEEAPDLSSPSAEDVVMTAERNAVLRAAFRSLPPDCQRLLSLLAQDPPLSYLEISDILGRSIGGLGPRRGRCLDRLRQYPPLVAMLEPGPIVKEGGRRDHTVVDR